MSKIVALNIFANDRLLNKTGHPILFYWNGTKDIIEEFSNNIDFKQWLINEYVLCDVNIYFDTKINYVILDKNETISSTILIKDLYPFNENTGVLFENIAKHIIANLYYKIQNTTVSDEQLNNIKAAYNTIYEDAMSFVSKETFILYIKTFIFENYKQLNNDDVNKIIDYLENL